MALGINLFKTKKRGLIRRKWKFETESSLLASPIICDLTNSGQKDIVYATKEGKVCVLDGQGQKKWEFDAKQSLDKTDMMFFDVETANSIPAKPQIYDLEGNKRHEIIFGSEMGTVYVLDSFGHLLWKFNAGGSIRGSITIKDVNGDGQPEIIFGSGDKFIYILDRKGNLLKKHGIGSQIESTPAVAGDKIIFGCNDGTVRCITYEGQELWSYKTNAKVVAKPVITKLDETNQIHIIVGSLDHYLYALDPFGELIWKFKTEGAIYAKVALADINKDKKLEILFGSCDNYVYALRSTGEKIWSFETGFWVVAPVIIDDIDHDGHLEVIVGSYDHNIYILDARGNYVLDYVPGLAGIIQQTGSYSDVMTSEPGKITAKKIWQFQTDGVIVGFDIINEAENIVVNTRKGIINDLEHKRGE